MPNQKKIRFLIVALAIFLFWPKTIWAASLSTPGQVPTEVQIGEAFSLNGEIIGSQPNEVYFIKCRLGPSFSSLSEGQTYNAATDQWLSDSGSSGQWVSMPTVEAQGEQVGFSLQCRLKTGVSAGDKEAFLRACLKEADGSCADSFQSAAGVSFTALAEPTPVPTEAPSATATPEVSPTPDHDQEGIVLSEFLPNPSEGGEWVEIQNTGNQEAVLNNWYLDDLAGEGGQPQAFSVTIAAGSYRQVAINGWLLNNSGDEVRLLDAEQTLIDKASYSGSQAGVSWIKSGTGWCESEHPTPGGSNSACRSPADSSPTAAPTPTKTLTPAPTPTTNLTGIEIAATMSSELGEVLGEEATETAFYPWEATEEAKPTEATASGITLSLWPKILMVLGLLILFSLGFWVWYTQLR